MKTQLSYFSLFPPFWHLQKYKFRPYYRETERNKDASDTWSLCLDDGLGRDADAAVVQRQLVAGQAVGPAVVVALHHRLAARLRALAHGLAGFDGFVLEVDGADGSVHGAQEEEQVGAAAGT